MSTKEDGFTASNLGALYGDINQGWNAVKIMGMTIIPYCWMILPRSRLWDSLLVGAMFEYLHVLCVFVVYTMYDIRQFDGPRGQPVWAIQALTAAFVRIVEIVFNALVIRSLQRAMPLWQTLFFGFTSAAIIAGRLFDVFVVSKASVWTSIRTGMAIVSIFGVAASAPVIFIFGRELWKLFRSDAFMKSTSKGTMLLQQSGTRLLFLNLIDVGLVFCFLIPGTAANPYFRWFFDNWDNSRLAYYAVDLLLSKVKMANHTESQARTGGYSRTGTATAPGQAHSKPAAHGTDDASMRDFKAAATKEVEAFL